MTYFDELREITKIIPDTIVDFSIPRDRTSPPTQASSNFITNKEQGDWAEDLIFRAINESSQNYIAVRYGKSDDLVAGEEGFDDFYNEFQDELDTIGKKPDLLIFRKTDFDTQLGLDILLSFSCQSDDSKVPISNLEISLSADYMAIWQSIQKMQPIRTTIYGWQQRAVFQNLTVQTG